MGEGARCPHLPPLHPEDVATIPFSHHLLAYPPTSHPTSLSAHQSCPASTWEGMGLIQQWLLDPWSRLRTCLLPLPSVEGGAAHGGHLLLSDKGGCCLLAPGCTPVLSPPPPQVRQSLQEVQPPLFLTSEGSGLWSESRLGGDGSGRDWRRIFMPPPGCPAFDVIMLTLAQARGRGHPWGHCADRDTEALGLRVQRYPRLSGWGWSSPFSFIPTPCPHSGTSSGSRSSRHRPPRIRDRTPAGGPSWDFWRPLDPTPREGKA